MTEQLLVKLLSWKLTIVPDGRQADESEKQLAHKTRPIFVLSKIFLFIFQVSETEAQLVL